LDKNKKPIARLIGQLRRVIILLPNISVRQNSPSSGAVKKANSYSPLVQDRGIDDPLRVVALLQACDQIQNGGQHDRLSQREEIENCSC